MNCPYCHRSIALDGNICATPLVDYLQIVAAIETRIKGLEAQFADVLKYGAPEAGVRAIVKRANPCSHDDYWATWSGTCMACRTEKAEKEWRIAVEDACAALSQCDCKEAK